MPEITSQPGKASTTDSALAVLNVIFVICDRMLATSVTLPMEQLRAAETLARSSRFQGFRQRQHHQINIRLASVDGNAVGCHTGLNLTPDCAIDSINDADIIYLPALWRNPFPVLRNNLALLNWIKRMHRNGSLIAGVGTGCCFMAEAGLLDNQPATTHWFFFDEFQRRYPQVILKRQYFITRANNLYCTGSVNSLADLTIHFIQRYFSQDIASHVERHFFHEIRKAYDSIQVFNEDEQAHPDETIIQVQLWMKENYDKAITLEDLAKHFSLSLRTLNRRFKNATGDSPLQYLQKIRINAAKELLQTSNLTIAETMYKVGYQDSTHFSRLFKKQHGITPRQYKTTVRAKLFDPH